jgi:hypothetical protein
MKLWASLYALVWLVFLELLVAIDPKPPGWFLYLHAALGLLIIVVAYTNYVTARASAAPGRIKRTTRATFALSILMAVLGPLLWANVGANVTVGFGVSVWDGLHLLHVANALAIFAQAAASASSYDMWEEKEFERPTRPGEIPPAVRPAS